MIKLPRIEPNLGALESAYRQAFLKGDAAQSIFVIGVSNLASLALIGADQRAFGWEPEFFLFLAARISVFVVSCLAIFVLLKSTQPRQHDWAVASYMLAGAFINIFINALKPPSYVAYIGVSIILLNIYYFALFSPLVARTVISYLFSIVVIFQAYHSSLDADSKAVVLGMHLLTNLIGTTISAKLYAHRRNSFKAQTEEKELQQELNVLASTDPLTEIWNRRKFTQSAIAEYERTQRYRRPLSLLLVDIDHLKHINDSFGHLAGDEALRHCAKILKAQTREQDILGRLGGDEFGLLMPETQLSEAVTVARRILETSRNKSIPLDGQLSHITFSMGVAELLQDDANYDDFFGRADKLLYRAKEGGRNSLIYMDGDAET